MIRSGSNAATASGVTSPAGSTWGCSPLSLSAAHGQVAEGRLPVNSRIDGHGSQGEYRVLVGVAEGDDPLGRLLDDRLAVLVGDGRGEDGGGSLRAGGRSAPAAAGGGEEGDDEG